jgi:sulfate adenylyltransferase subunit 2
MTDPQRYQLSQLQTLEAEAIFIIREVVAEFERPVLLFSGGKDSITMLRLAEKAFHPARIPFPVMHVDTGHNFQEVLDFRDRRVEELGVQLVVASVQEAIDNGSVVEPPDGTRNRIQTPVLLDALEKHRFTAIFGGARRDEDKARAKERIFSFRDDFGQWDPKNQRPELWSLYNGGSTTARASGSSRCPTGPSSTSGSTSSGRASSCRRSTSRTSGRCSPGAACSSASIRTAGPATARRSRRRVRYRTVGDASLTAAVESDADTVAKVIAEVATTRITERGATRGDDKFSEAAMEDRKREGYF